MYSRLYYVSKYWGLRELKLCTIKRTVTERASFWYLFYCASNIDRMRCVCSCLFCCVCRMAWMRCTWLPKRVILTLLLSCLDAALRSTQLLKYVLSVLYCTHAPPPTHTHTLTAVCHAAGNLFKHFKTKHLCWLPYALHRFDTFLWTLKRVISDVRQNRKFEIQNIACVS